MHDDTICHHILIDFENVPAVDLTPLVGQAIEVTLLIGERQKQMKIDQVTALVAGGSAMRLIKVGVTGRNALDLTLAYYLGRASLENPRAEFHIISRDTDYDAMIEHVNRRGVRVERVESVDELDFLQRSIAPGRDEEPADSGRIDDVIELLDRNEASRPKTKKRLRSSIASWYASEITEEELDEILLALERRRIVAIDDRGRVSYKRS